MFKIINNCFKLKHKVFSQNCLFCLASIKDSHLSICDPCLRGLPFQSETSCPQCGLVATKGEICGHCLKSAPAFDITRGLFEYQYPINTLLQKYKYGKQLDIATALGKLLSRRVPSTALPDILIPMPLHPRRLQERGFNQAVEIARVVADELHILLDVHACKRVKFSAPQVTLPLKERVRNMRNAFTCQRPLDNLRVVLLDDVMTTGASLTALASAVKKAGASHVECWVVARTQPGISHV
jgi:ComF family protein